MNALAIAGIMGVVVWNAWQYFDKKKKDRDTDYDKTGAGLIKLLKDTSSELLEQKKHWEEEKLLFKRERESWKGERESWKCEREHWKKKLENMEARLLALEERNTLLEGIFQGRDADAIKFREKGVEAFECVKNINDMLVATHANTLKLLHQAPKSNETK